MQLTKEQCVVTTWISTRSIKRVKVLFAQHFPRRRSPCEDTTWKSANKYQQEETILIRTKAVQGVNELRDPKMLKMCEICFYKLHKCQSEKIVCFFQSHRSIVFERSYSNESYSNDSIRKSTDELPSTSTAVDSHATSNYAAEPAAPPPTSCVSEWPLRTQASRVSSFTVDSILAHQRSPHKTASSVDHHCKIAVQDVRISSRPSPYPNSVDIGSPTNNGSVTATGKHNKTRRNRTIFTAEQLERLEAEFARQQYMVGPERVYLAQSLRLSEAQVKVWFQNRRIKWRKQTTEKQRKRFPNAFMDHLDHENSQSPPSSPEQLEVSSTDLSVKNDEAASSLSMEKLPVNAADEQQSLNSGVQQASRSSSPLLSPSGNPSASVSPPSTVTSIDPGYEALQNVELMPK
ncbi:Homeobox domain [Trinorchestia longiramus]|nr:Homeobox domain [Trinorchestia longiramus]